MGSNWRGTCDRTETSLFSCSLSSSSLSFTSFFCLYPYSLCESLLLRPLPMLSPSSILHSPCLRVRCAKMWELLEWEKCPDHLSILEVLDKPSYNLLTLGMLIGSSLLAIIFNSNFWWTSGLSIFILLCYRSILMSFQNPTFKNYCGLYIFSGRIPLLTCWYLGLPWTSYYLCFLSLIATFLFSSAYVSNCSRYSTSRLHC